MKDTQKLLSEMRKPTFSNSAHQDKLKRALLNSEHFKQKKSILPNLFISLSTGAVLAAIVFAVIFSNTDIFGTRNNEPGPKTIASTTENSEEDTEPVLIADNTTEETFELGNIRKFKSEEELSTFVNEKQEIYDNYQYLEDGQQYSGLPEGGGGGGDVAVEFSDTNTQEENVDEPDTVKNDGKYIYAASEQSTVVIFEAFPAEKMRKVSEIIIKETGETIFRTPSIFLKGDTLIATIIVNEQPLEGTVMSPRCGFLSACPQKYTETRTITSIYDISDRSNPKLKDTINVSGYSIDSRMIGDYVYLVANQRLTQQVILPSIIKNDQETFTDADDIFYNHETGKTDLMFSNILAINTTNGSVSKQTTLSEVNDEIYVSENNIYTLHSNWRNVAASDASKTIINKTSINKESISYVASTEVTGLIDSKFSLDEYKGNLRIATTNGNNWDEDSVTVNNVYVLDANLNKIGALENLAPSERIYSVRFTGNKGYVVTYKEVDPLFVINLEDPTNPQVQGELKIPGYSEYLHPYDENHIIGFGRETEIITIEYDDGPVTIERNKGLKMTIFNVTDPSNPKEMFTEIIGEDGSNSEGLYDHKAFLFDRKKGILSIPITIGEILEGNDYGSTVYQGAVVYKIDLSSGFTLAGKISHHSPADQETLRKGEYIEKQYARAINRILYMDDYLYTVSNSTIKAHTLWDLKELFYAEF